MARSTRRVRRGGRTQQKTQRSALRKNTGGKKSGKKGGKKTSRRQQGSGPGDKMDKMTLTQQFGLNPALREARKLMSEDELTKMVHYLSKLDTKAEQLELLGSFAAPFVKKPKGHVERPWGVCPHHGLCLTEGVCHDREEDRQSK